jgi:hypothetical protein
MRPYPLDSSAKIRETYDYSIAVLWLFTIDGNLPPQSAMTWLMDRKEDREYGESSE